jgi:hypothetical protein
MQTQTISKRIVMPISKKSDGWYWGSKGPFASKQKAIQVGQAAHASGFKEANMDGVIGVFISTLLHSATLTHLMHFKTTSYSQHVALNAYYDEIPELVDSLVESIQGAYEEIIQPYPSMFGNGNGDDPLAYMISLRNYVRDYRVQMPQDSEIQNEIDSIANLINHTVYKLKFLK